MSSVCLQSFAGTFASIPRIQSLVKRSGKIGCLRAVRWHCPVGSPGCRHRCHRRDVAARFPPGRGGVTCGPRLPLTSLGALCEGAEQLSGIRARSVDDLGGQCGVNLLTRAWVRCRSLAAVTVRAARVLSMRT